MKQIFLTILIISFGQNLRADEPILQLDTGGHTGLIRDIIVTKSGDIISASDDKTIRIWDSKTGREKRKILGEIGAGTEGMDFAIALSPDEKYLAVGGFFAEGFGVNGDLVGAIRIYDYTTGKLITLLKGHRAIIPDLAFSADGRYLISGSADRTAKIWSVRNNFSLKDTIFFHTKDVYAVRIIMKHKKYYAVTAGYDKKIALYDMQKRKIIKSQKSNYLFQFLATSHNLFGGRIAACGSGKEIYIYDFNLNLIKTVKSETIPKGLAYSKDGKFLISGFAFIRLKLMDAVYVYRSQKNYKKVISFGKQKDLTMAVNFLDRYTAISGGGNSDEIYLWDTRTSKIKKKIVGTGKRILSVGIKGNVIGWGNRWTGNSHAEGSRLQKTFDLESHRIDDVLLSRNHYGRLYAKKGSLILSHKKGGEYGRSDAILVLKKGKKILASIVRNSANGYQHRCYGFYKDLIITGGNHGNLEIYNFQGKRVAKLVGHTGDIWSIAVEGDKLVSGSGDQTIRMWNLSDIDADSDQTLYPMINVFVANNNEWVIWSHSGYFTSSVNGDKYIGYHINRGFEKEAYFVTSDKYYDKLYRPDIIHAILETGSEAKALKSISRNRKIEKADIVSEMPPILTLLSDSSVNTAHKTITIDFAIESSNPTKELIVTRNGERVEAVKIPSAKKGSVNIDLDDGENIISIRAKNKYAVSDALLIRALKSSSVAETVNETIYKPTLYLLSIGVSQYKNKEYNLEVADKDARSIIKMFKKQEGKIYKKVVSKELTNETATKDNILDALEWIERETTQRDMVIIFVAGHGINDDKGNYYFMAYDSDVNKLRRSALRWIEIKDTISDLPSKVILMVDTCHSGNILGQERRRDITGAIKSIINSGTGSIIMTASTGRGYSIENKSWGHGAFTKALLEGMEDAKADYNNNQSISIKEMDLYVTDRVKVLTKGKQKPTTIIPESIPDFAVGVR